MNRVKEALRARTPCLGGWAQLGHPGVAEVFARAGYDWVCADLEHGDVQSFADFARGAGNTPVFARVRENATLEIRRALDCGADGVIVPLVSTREEAERAVAAAKYPPEGVRGFAFCRANNWGADFDAYAAAHNDSVCVVVMIETKRAVESIDAILSVPGVDGVLVGPYDLSGSLGVVGQTGHPLVREALQIVSAACARHDKGAGQHLVTPSAADVRAALSEGYTFLALGMDTVFLAEGASRCLAAARGTEETT